MKKTGQTFATNKYPVDATESDSAPLRFREQEYILREISEQKTTDSNRSIEMYLLDICFLFDCQELS
jgi:hypothetical protein